MSASTQPPLHATLGRQVEGGERRWPLSHCLLSWASTKGCTHSLKLRHSFRVGACSRLELGVDLAMPAARASQQQAPASPKPFACLAYQLDPKERGKGRLIVNPKGVAFGRQYRLGRQGAWWEVPLDVKLGVSYTDKLHMGLEIGNLLLALALAGAMLAVFGRPICLHHREVGGVAVHFPLRVGGHDAWLQERVEVEASLRRRGGGLQLAVHQLNGVLRLQQD